MRASILSLLLVVVAVTAAAAHARPVSTTNPCKLVTVADARATLGAPVGRTTVRKLGLYQSCTYKTKAFKLLTVQTRRLGRSDFVKSAKANPGPVVAVRGIGAAAYSVAGGSALLVWKDGTEATFSIFGAGRAINTTERLAKKVVRRL